MEKVTNEKWAFIVNPISGNGDGEKLLAVLEKKVEEYGITATIELTKHHGHAIDLTRKFATQGYDYIIAVGGDGTMNEVGSVLTEYPDITTGIIPAGTGNDFNQILGFPDRYEDSHWETFFKKEITMMDYGTCNGIIFLNGMGLGFDAEVAAKNYVAPNETKMGGQGKYIKAILSTLFFFKEYNVKIKTRDFEEETPCFINTISNGRRYAGGFFLTPHAIANDGLLDVCMIKKLGLLKRLDILLKVTKGKHTNDKKVNYYKTDWIEVDFGKKVPFHVDGELYHDSKFEVKIYPEKIKIIYNPTGDHWFKK